MARLLSLLSTFLMLIARSRGQDDSSFVGEQYVAPREVQTTADLPRFGYPNDVGVLFAAVDNGGTWGNEQQEYIIGCVSQRRRVFIKFLSIVLRSS